MNSNQKRTGKLDYYGIRGVVFIYIVMVLLPQTFSHCPVVCYKCQLIYRKLPIQVKLFIKKIIIIIKIIIKKKSHTLTQETSNVYCFKLMSIKRVTLVFLICPFHIIIIFAIERTATYKVTCASSLHFVVWMHRKSFLWR